MKYRTKFGRVITVTGRPNIKGEFLADDGKVFTFRDTSVYLIGSKAKFKNKDHWLKTKNTSYWEDNHQIYMGEAV